MRLLYVDNYRGFSDTFVPIEDVNFLVGENSSGKTSILTLINLLSSPFFWFELDFNLDDIQLGRFKDIVSIDSIDQSYFKIGLLECNKSSKNKTIENPYIFLFTFSQSDGLPSLQQYSFLHNNNAITARISSKGISYINETIKENIETQSDMIQVFQKWIRNGYQNKEFKELPYKINKRSTSYPPSLIRSIIAEELKLENFKHGIRVPDFGRNNIWIAPIRSKPRRTYDQYRTNYSPEGEHAPYLIQKLINDKSKSIRFNKFLDEFGQNSGLFKKVSIKQFLETPESPFELDIFLWDKPINIEYVGYGVSQSLPIIVESFAQNKYSWFSIQQPEVHLHPRAQAALGDLFYYFSTKEDKKFLIETHSDYTIDRFRLNIRKGKNKKIKSQVLFFERNEKGNTVTPLVFDENGNYPEDQPKSFREFFIKEELNMLGLD
jgi:predicted ATPase